MGFPEPCLCHSCKWEKNSQARWSVSDVHMGFIGGRWCNSNGLFFWPSQRSLLWLQSLCMFDYVTFHFYWVYGCERSKRHIFGNMWVFFLPSKCIPCRKSFFSYCLHKCLFEIYLMAMIVWKLCWRDFLLNIYRLNHLYHHQPIFVEESSYVWSLLLISCSVFFMC